MKPEEIYIAIAIAALFVIVVLLFLARPAQKEKGLSPLAALSFGFIITGIIFGEARWLGYSLIGTGVVLSIADIIVKTRQSADK